MPEEEIPDSVYLDAARAYAEALSDRVTEDYANEVMSGWPWHMRPEFGAAVAVAFQAGLAARPTVGLSEPGVDVVEMVGTFSRTGRWLPADDRYGIRATHRRQVIMLPAVEIKEAEDGD